MIPVADQSSTKAKRTADVRNVFQEIVVRVTIALRDNSAGRVADLLKEPSLVGAQKHAGVKGALRLENPSDLVERTLNVV
jgi:hypothetical protein